MTRGNGLILSRRCITCGYFSAGNLFKPADHPHSWCALIIYDQVCWNSDIMWLCWIPNMEVLVAQTFHLFFLPPPHKLTHPTTSTYAVEVVGVPPASASSTAMNMINTTLQPPFTECIGNLPCVCSHLLKRDTNAIGWAYATPCLFHGMEGFQNKVSID